MKELTFLKIGAVGLGVLFVVSMIASNTLTNAVQRPPAGTGWIEIGPVSATSPAGKTCLARAVVGPVVTDEHGHFVRPAAIFADYGVNTPVAAKSVRLAYHKAENEGQLRIIMGDPSPSAGNTHRAVVTLYPYGCYWQIAKDSSDFRLEISFE